MYSCPPAAATPACEQHRSTLTDTGRHAAQIHHRPVAGCSGEAPPTVAASSTVISWAGDGFRVEQLSGGRRPVAFVKAGQVRSRGDAHAFAERIARDPDSYLAVLNEFRVPGVHDLRRGLPAVVLMPTSRRHPGTIADDSTPWFGRRREAGKAVPHVA